MASEKNWFCLKVEHSWNVSLSQASSIQEKLRQYIIRETSLTGVRRIAGVDCAYTGEEGVAVVVVCSYPDLQVIAREIQIARVTFPYHSGFLAFREGPLILKVLARMKVEPDLFFFNGHGLLHPRNLGLATHLGILLDKPSIGCARRLIKNFPGMVTKDEGGISFVESGGEKIGAVLSSPDSRKKLFLSPGHRVSLKEAIFYVTSCSVKNLLPLPLYLAHHLASKEKRKLSGKNVSRKENFSS